MTCSRRAALLGLSAGAFAPMLARAAPVLPDAPPRMRVIVDNDLAGDPDGLFQLAHALRSPSADVRLIVGSHLHSPQDAEPDDGHQADKAAAKARELLALMGLAGRVPVVRGAEGALGRADRRSSAEAVAAIVAEGMRSDVQTPLFYTAGAGLTDLAAALQAEPSLAQRMTLVWIGGAEHDGVALPPPGGTPGEYNFTIDPAAAQFVFGQSGIPIWQVPRNAYRQMLVSLAELRVLAQSGPVGAWLVAQLDHMRGQLTRIGRNLGEVYALGDSPLVTLTALQAAFEPDPASSRYHLVPTPRLGEDGAYLPRPDGRPMRVYDWIDTRLTFADMFAKLEH
ncbi:nucleoside hydrolase [Novosphingobium sp. SG720]|uniref:nucleoside hydrolase n=1 Tax=Novosphingobium sp. SG720 TaxID=2586998 RepID=UPI001446D7FD|nr:nucleoside hydrolase [Novosphingobium sp. SG720]NKJ41361.1 inosine-uridine nucleoside N-ribohydrolase [Novosphingobium sp. SG720]